MVRAVLYLYIMMCCAVLCFHVMRTFGWGQRDVGGLAAAAWEWRGFVRARALSHPDVPALLDAAAGDYLCRHRPTTNKGQGFRGTRRCCGPLPLPRCNTASLPAPDTATHPPTHQRLCWPSPPSLSPCRHVPPPHPHAAPHHTTTQVLARALCHQRAAWPDVDQVSVACSVPHEHHRRGAAEQGGAGDRALCRWVG